MALGDATRINTNIAAFNALAALKRVNVDLEKRQLKLATGLRINEVSDDPANFVITRRLDARIRGLGAALDNGGGRHIEKRPLHCRGWSDKCQ